MTDEVRKLINELIEEFDLESVVAKEPQVDLLSEITEIFTAFLHSSIRRAIPQRIAPMMVIAIIQDRLNELFEDMHKEEPEEYERLNFVISAITQARRGNVGNIRILIDELKERNKKL